MLAIQDNPALRKAFYENVFLPRRAEGRKVVQEAITAGELTRHSRSRSYNQFANRTTDSACIVGRKFKCKVCRKDIRLRPQSDFALNSKHAAGYTMETPSTRDHLLRAGLQRIHAMGYASTGVKEILDDADVPKGSFYHHFPSKEAFAKEVLKLYVRGENERAEKILRNGKGAPLKRLRRYFEELIAVYGQTATVSGCMLGNLSLEIADHSDSIQSLVRLSFSNWQTAIAGTLEEAMEQGGLAKANKPEDLAAFLLNSYEGALLRSKADRSNKPLENFLHFAFKVLLKG